MTIKKLTYIGLSLLTAFFSACSDDTMMPNTLSGDGTKTPLSVTALLDAGGSSTRAADKDFANGDALLAYLRHVTWNGGFTADDADQRNVVSADQAPRLVTFTCTGSTTWDDEKDDILPFVTDETIAIMGKGENPDTKQATGLTASYTNTAGETVTALYWDDFSANDANDGQESSLNLRDEGHYLQSYYGYCYNGGTPTAALTNETGILGWSVAEDQTAADKSAFKTSDLLWSAEQTPVKYAHVDGEGNRNHGTLILPYTHAMSKVTIKVTLHESFGISGVAFNKVSTTLHNMFSACTCQAPTYTFIDKGVYDKSTYSVGTTTDIAMWNEKSTDETATRKCTFEAIVVPSVLSVVNNFATITGLDGNKYVIPITEAMLQVATVQNKNKGWGGELTETTEHINNGIAQSKPRKTNKTINKGKGYEMKSGVNYVLEVNISKQQITVSATIKDWLNVEAMGTALVQFNSDVTGKQDITDTYLKNHGFDVYKNSVNTDFTVKTTTLSWDNNNSKWIYNPVVYWAGQGDDSYFRALSPTNTTTTMNQGTDILWGYACDDDANNGSKVGTDNEAKITPRTGDVPLHFEHPLSKISVKLETPVGDASDPQSPAVALSGALITISNLAKTGTLELVKGSITPGEIKAETAIDGTVSATASGTTVTTGTTSIANLPVIPQTIGNDAVLRITLKDGPDGTDGTTYSLKLNACVDSNSNADPKPAITEWQRGKHYTYTIHIEKEAITFRALIKDWDENTGSGNATLEWD